MRRRGHKRGRKHHHGKSNPRLWYDYRPDEAPKKKRAPRKKKEPPLTIAEAAARPVRKIRLVEE